MTRTIAVRIDERLISALDAASASRPGGRSAIVREALAMWLRHRDLQEKVRRHQEGYRRHPVGDEEFASVLDAQVWPR